MNKKYKDCCSPIFDPMFSKIQKNSKKQRKPQKICSWYVGIVFSIFSVISKEFKFLKVFWTCSTFNASFSKLTIFLIWVDIDKKNQNLQKKKEKRKKTMRDQFGNLATFYYKYKSTQDKKGHWKKYLGRREKFFEGRVHRKP